MNTLVKKLLDTAAAPVNSGVVDVTGFSTKLFNINMAYFIGTWSIQGSFDNQNWFTVRMVDAVTRQDYSYLGYAVSAQLTTVITVEVPTVAPFMRVALSAITNGSVTAIFFGTESDTAVDNDEGSITLVDLPTLLRNAAGQSDWMPTGSAKQLMLVTDVTVVNAVTLTMILEGRMSNGVVITLATGAAITTVSQQLIPVGPGQSAIPANIAPREVRIRWTLTGTNATFSAVLLGRI